MYKKAVKIWEQMIQEAAKIYMDNLTYKRYYEKYIEKEVLHGLLIGIIMDSSTIFAIIRTRRRMRTKYNFRKSNKTRPRAVKPRD